MRTGKAISYSVVRSDDYDVTGAWHVYVGAERAGMVRRAYGTGRTWRFQGWSPGCTRVGPVRRTRDRAVVDVLAAWQRRKEARG